MQIHDPWLASSRHVGPSAPSAWLVPSRPANPAASTTCSDQRVAAQDAKIEQITKVVEQMQQSQAAESSKLRGQFQNDLTQLRSELKTEITDAVQQTASKSEASAQSIQTQLSDFRSEILLAIQGIHLAQTVSPAKKKSRGQQDKRDDGMQDSS